MARVFPWNQRDLMLMELDHCLQDMINDMGCSVETTIHLFSLDLETGDVHLQPSESITGNLHTYFDELSATRVPFPSSGDAAVFQAYDGFRVTAMKHLELALQVEPEFQGWRCLVTPMHEKLNVLYSIFIAVRKEDFERYRVFSEGHRRLGWDWHAASFLEAALRVFQRELHRFLAMSTVCIRPEPAEFNPREILRKAGSVFTTVASLSAGSTGEQRLLYHGNFDFFDACNAISTMKYERSEVTGGMLLANRDLMMIDLKVEFDRQVKVTEHRTVRKLLEMCDEDRRLYLACDGIFIAGLGSIKDDYDPKRMEDTFLIRFPAHHVWDLIHGEKVIMRVTRGIPGYPMPPFEPHEFSRRMGESFSTMPDADRQRVVVLVADLAVHGHGTTIVISLDAKEEARRLSAECTPIKPIVLDEPLARSLSSIDGALLLDPTCTCYAVGVILDGHATLQGNPGRGSRYNSGVRYSEGHKGACLVVVVSDDGSVEVLPKEPLVQEPMRDPVTGRIVK